MSSFTQPINLLFELQLGLLPDGSNLIIFLPICLIMHVQITVGLTGSNMHCPDNEPIPDTIFYIDLLVEVLVSLFQVKEDLLSTFK